MFLFHGLSFDILENRKKIGGHRTNYLSGGPNLTPFPQISRIIQYKTLRSVIFAIYIIPYYLYEVILLYKAKKEKEKKNVTSAHPGIDPGPLVPKSDTLATRPRCQVVYGSK